MSLRRTAAIVRRIVEEIHRDRPSLALLFVAPIVITGLVAFILRGSVAPDTNAIVVNEAGAAVAPVADAIVSALHQQGASAILVTDETAARSAIDAGSASVAVIMPSDLAGQLAAGAPPTIRVLTRGLDPSAEGQQVAVVGKALVVAASQAFGVRAPTIQHDTLYGTAASSDPVAPFAPMIVGFFAYFFVYILTGVSFLRERTAGTLERLLATPVARGEIVAGYTIGFGLFATIQVGLLLAWALGSAQVGPIGPLPAFSIGLGLAVAGSSLFAFIVVLLLALGAVSLGIFLSTFARTELQIIQFIPLVLAPQFLLSGVLFPTTSLPSILRPVAAVMPLSYAVDGLRQVFVRGGGQAGGAREIDQLGRAGFVLFFATIASLTIRREVV
jgi:ABC-2 type transport system permease protein